MSRIGLVLVLAGVLLNAVAQFCLKSATQVTGPIALDTGSLGAGLLRIAAVPATWIGLACYGLSVVVWVLALSRVPVTVAYPMLSLGYVVNAVAARLWLGESLGTTRILAIGVILAGVFLLAQSRDPSAVP